MGQVDVDAVDCAHLFRLAGYIAIDVMPDTQQQILLVFQSQANRGANLPQTNNRYLDCHLYPQLSLSNNCKR